MKTRVRLMAIAIASSFAVPRARQAHYMKLAAAVLLVALALVTGPAWATTIDPVAVTLTSPADVAARRAALIDETWGTTTLPVTQPTVTTIANPFGSKLPDVGAVYDYHAAMSNGQVNDSDLYTNSDPNGRVVIMNMGHMNTTSWPSFHPIYNTVPMMTALLKAGFSIYAMNMPDGGECCADHPALFRAYGNAAMQYFLEPAVQAMNYWDAHQTFSQYDFVGLSTGGWTGIVLQALDTRLETVISDAGGLPGTQFCCATVPLSDLPNQGDRSRGSEENWAPFFSIAGYVDLYLMGASGTGRSQVQILNINDTCCYGPRQWNSYYAAANAGRTWYQQVAYYSALVAAASVPSDLAVVEDYSATAHQISNPYAVDLALNTLLGDGPPPGESTSLADDPPLGAPQADSVPEPASVLLLGIGLVGLGFVRRRRS